MDQCEQVAPEAAQVLGGDGQHGIGGDRRVDSIAAGPEDIACCGRGQQIDRRDHGPGSADLHILDKERHCRSMAYD